MTIHIHIAPGEESTWKATSTACHYAYGDSRCWTPCNNDKNHKKKTGQLVQHGDEVVNISDTFINIDREFKIYYPNTGDFSQSPTAWNFRYQHLSEHGVCR